MGASAHDVLGREVEMCYAEVDGGDYSLNSDPFERGARRAAVYVRGLGRTRAVLVLGAMAFGLVQAGASAHAEWPLFKRPTVETRCGWWINPTPGNLWLRDRDAEWVITLQGGYEAAGSDRPTLSFGAAWVPSEGPYGHGCACVRGVVDARSKGFTRVVAWWARPLKTCREDPGLRRFEPQTADD